jgi:hypothetical protein
MPWDIIKMSRIYEKHKHFATGIIWATLGLGVMYFVRKYRGHAFHKQKRVNTPGNGGLEKVVVVNSFRECEVVAQALQRLVVRC